MTRLHLRWPATTVISYVAAATTWVTMLAWTPFAERPAEFMVPLLGVCLLVATAGALLRATRVPVLLVPVAQLLVVALWLQHRWAGAQALGGWLPTPESLTAVRALLSAGADAAQAYAAPVPQSAPEFATLLVLAGAATAVLVDLLACGFRRAPLAGLPLLAAYTAPVSILDGGVPWVKFACAAMMFLILIACQEAVRLTHWGQQVSARGTTDPTVTGQAVWSSARKIGVSATAVAVVVPLLVPTLSLEWFGSGNGTGSDGDPVTLSNPIADLKRDLVQGPDVDLVRVRTSEGDPTYLRISVLDSFDGETWRPSGRQIPVEQRASGLVPRPPGLDAAVDRRTTRWSIDISKDFSSIWLPVPYPIYSINAPGDWRYDRRTLDVISATDTQSTAGMRYDLEAIQVRPTPAQLAEAAPAPATVFGPYTDFPDTVPDLVRDLALKVTAGTRNKYDAAKALQRWFRVDGGFRYSTVRVPSGNGVNDLEAFLRTGKGGRVGYCEQFAAAMALMGRTIGIPSRVAVGFLRPDPVGNDTYVYSSRDLHAWPEMYFEGTGWVRFEPTPGVRTGAAPAYTRQTGPLPQDPEVSASAAAPRPSLNRFDEPSASTDAGAAGAGGDGSGPADWLVGLGVLVLAALLAVTPRLARSAVRRRRWAGVATPRELAETAWAELRATALDLGIAWDDRGTLRARARDLVASFGRPGQQEDAFTRAPARGPRRTRRPPRRSSGWCTSWSARATPGRCRSRRPRRSRSARTSTSAPRPWLRAPAAGSGPGRPGCRSRWCAVPRPVGAPGCRGASRCSTSRASTTPADRTGPGRGDRSATGRLPARAHDRPGGDHAETANARGRGRPRA
ncbi:transglutaminaseTgpA domain-containing protein [Nocardioides mesophilus]|uniref:Transglutaminase-like domain-containing protein n=1 Tax=Nocardioides mesophilus TaxID=433659 RepID=A0A7G9RBX6_9ACTN|nr:transglutaminaseTgpA domain-containing protein [Nocardioides mesophilus]QNN53101.1 hypothetical protein H9L09_00940 [Nocardioides mesophilus]